MTPVWRNAPAKINLALHVTGQREDGYHLLETIAVFADIGDRISAAPAEKDEFAITGPEAAALAGEAPERNLVVRARDMLRAILVENGLEAPPVALTLDKALPAGSGIGGGSADAGATLSALMELWACEHLAAVVASRAVTLGADVPMCLNGKPLVARGIGDILSPVHSMPALHLVLANPRVHVSTPAVFAALTEKRNPPLALDAASALHGVQDWADWLGWQTRNDLEPPSVLLEPSIGACLDALCRTPVLLARMSGSGATCFGLYANRTDADAAATRLLRDHPDWWIKTCTTGPSVTEDA